jgi:hypothetical protein
MKVILLLAAVIVLLLGVTLGQRITLIASEQINIQESAEGKKTIAVVPAGTRLDVLDCHDDKSLIVPRVRLDDGSIGYAVYGAFRLERAGIFDGQSKAPISFSCPRP